jgi:hypothetical protein
VLGLHRPSHCHTHCTVVSDSWPGWLAILPSNAFQCHRLFIIDPSASWLPVLLQYHVDCQVLPIASTSDIQEDEWVFGQGSSAIGASLTLLPQARWIFSLNASDSWSREGSLILSHADYWGVIQGSWVFWCSEPLQIPECPSVEGRTLFHVLDSSSKVTDFLSCPPPDFAPRGRTVQWIETFQEVRFVDNDQSIVDGWGLLPSDGVLDAVQCPLVYS